MVEGKEKFALWITPETKQLVAEKFKEDNCRSMSEFMEKAILFYCGYLTSKAAENYLPNLLGDILTARLDMFGDRMGKLLFKYAVESNISNHILAADTDIDLETYDKLRARSVREVRETNGSISFKDDVKFQKGL
jgi:hypothetical protein